MVKKFKRNMLLMTGLAGSLIATSAAGVALSSCTTTSSASDSNVQYSYVIDWSDPTVTDRLTIDNNGLVYSDSSKTTLIATAPNMSLTTITIPSSVKTIAGYAKVVTGTNGVKTYESVGAFQDNVLLQNIILESGSNLQSIGASAFYGCTNLKTITGLSNSLTFVGDNAFSGCSNLTSIDISNVINVGIFAFYNCTSLASVDLSNAITIGRGAFWNCTGLTSLGSLEKAKSIGRIAFANATASGSNISLKLPNLTALTELCFAGSQGITSIDFSGNTALTSFDMAVFRSSAIVTVDFTGCSNLTTIGERAFKDCSKLTTVYLPSNDATSLTSIGSNAFIDCTSLTTVNVKGASTTAPGFVATSKLNSIGSNFLANTAITSVDLSNFVISSTSSTTQFGSTTPLAFIYNLSSVTLPEGLTTLNAGLFYKSGTNSTNGFSLTLPSTITSIQYTASLTVVNGSGATGDSTGTQETVTNATAFTGSGVGSVDMSKVTSYQTTTGSELTLPNYLFNGATKLTSVVLKAGTTAIGNYDFQGTTALTSITYGATANTPATTADANGFTASATLTTIGTDAFNGAFSETSNAVVDLTAMTFTTSPAAFTGSNVATLNLPTTVETIATNSFDNMTKLSSVNFTSLTSLKSIQANNFNNTQLTTIDLSNTVLTSISSNTFTGLPATAVASLPTTMAGAFSGIFTTTNEDGSTSYVSFSFPNGINSGILASSYTTNGVLSGLATASGSAGNILKNLSSLNLSSNTTVTSVGTNTFFGNSKFTSLTMSGNSLTASSTLFTGATIATANTSKTETPATYVTANLPFGSNSAFTSLNYANFSTTANNTTTAQALFERTNATTWTAVAKIINSLSNYTYAEGDGDNSGANIPANLSSWTPVTSDATTKTTILTDSVATYTAATTGSSATAAKVVLNNSFAVGGSATGDITIQSTDTTTTFIHNGITWTYTNDGTNITLTGEANMYKATVGSNSYLTFFNNDQVQYQPSSGSAVTYNIPSQTKVAVTLTIATATTSSAN